MPLKTKPRFPRPTISHGEGGGVGSAVADSDCSDMTLNLFNLVFFKFEPIFRVFKDEEYIKRVEIPIVILAVMPKIIFLTN